MGMSLALLAEGFARAATLAAALAGSAKAEPPPAGPAIWTIEKQGGATITLYGSLHLLPEGENWRTPALARAFAKADVIVLETNVADMQSAEMQAYLKKHALYEGNETLSAKLSPEQKADVAKGLAKAGLGPRALERFRPWFAALQLSVSYALAQGFSPDRGVDQIIAAEGEEAGKAFDYLESAREQLDVFIELPEKEQIAFLVNGAREVVERPDEMTLLVKAWMSGDVAAIDEFMNRGYDGTPAVMEALLERRNARWLKKIQGFYLKDRNSYLIVVGAGHLAGENGVPEMLRDAGVEVKGP